MVCQALSGARAGTGAQFFEEWIDWEPPNVALNGAFGARSLTAARLRWSHESVSKMTALGPLRIYVPVAHVKLGGSSSDAGLFRNACYVDVIFFGSFVSPRWRIPHHFFQSFTGAKRIAHTALDFDRTRGFYGLSRNWDCVNEISLITTRNLVFVCICGVFGVLAFSLQQGSESIVWY